MKAIGPRRDDLPVSAQVAQGAALAFRASLTSQHGWSLLIVTVTVLGVLYEASPITILSTLPSAASARCSRAAPGPDLA